MNRPEIYESLTELLREVLGNDLVTIRADTVASDVEGWDSFNHLNIIVAVETRFGIKIGSREIDTLRTVGDLVEVISRQLRVS